MVDMKELTKVKDLTPTLTKVNVLVKIVKDGEVREVSSRFGPSKKVSDTTVGDDSGTVVMSLWQDQVGTVKEGDVIYIDNGYVSLFKGHMRLNIGKYGTLNKSEQAIENVNTGVDMSEKEHPQERREDRGFGGRSSGCGYGGRGGDDRGRSSRF